MTFRTIIPGILSIQPLSSLQEELELFTKKEKNMTVKS